MKYIKKINLWEYEYCPLSGLPLKKDKKYENVNFGSHDYKVSFLLIDKSIIYVKTRGISNLSTTKKYFTLLDKFANEKIPKNEKYVLIEDYTFHKKATIKAKKCYIELQNKNPRIRALIFFGASSMFKVLINICKRIVNRSEPIKILSDYKAAILFAVTLEPDL